MDQDLLNLRLSLGKQQYLPERFAKSPNITESRYVTSELLLSYAPQDEHILPLVEEAYRKAYAQAMGWFEYPVEMALDLWMAPEELDLHYMACQPWDAQCFCAPGQRNGRGVILFVSPLSCATNSAPNHLAGCLGHEITHHLLEKITQSTVFTMKRKEEQGLPMWLEEGLCQVIQGDLAPASRHRWQQQISEITTWYDLDDLWNDLSSCSDVHRTYLQAYHQTRALLDTYGKEGILRLLYLSGTHSVDWNSLTKEAKAGKGDTLARDSIGLPADKVEI